MVDKLVAALGEGEEIETQTETQLLLDFIKQNWPISNPYITGLPVKSDIDFGASPDRTSKSITISTYRIFSNVIDKDIGSYTYMFNIPIAIDIFVRDVTAQSERREPTKLTLIESYIRDFITGNRLGLRNKGINNMRLDNVEYVEEPPDDEKGNVWFHLVVSVRIFYHMHRKTT